ncbi:alpha/beta fold hydrolase [Shewanella dokdonensis]|uniref:alpha/beta fold hydrolase n=1 Tax=Shewanella dokdonensis TaxID=712036 RepID=UPI00200F370D|nr:alpha/beta hydrolase [Shewanella dokdonensis]MCL1073202.1 alpha/beta hydrolase [Shewanella dokdonensis]
MELWQSSGPVNGEIDLGEQRVAVRCWGDASKPLLIALHGWLDNANSFEPLANCLQADYRILAIDWPGHGLSPWRQGHYPLHWADYLYDLHRLLNVVGNERPVFLMGHSLGGVVASAYTAAYPERIAALVLIEALTPLFEDIHHQQARLRKSFQQTLEKLQQARHYTELEKAVDSRYRLTGLAPQWCRLILQRNLAQDAVGSYWRTDPRLRTDSPQRLSLAQVEQLMRGIAVPSLLLTGTEGYASLSLTGSEKYTSLAELLHQAASWFRSLTKVQLTGNHHLHMGNAAEVALIIKDFLAQSKCVSRG